ncbi:Mitochondrial carrier domain containing protein [Amanita muscaria]
MPEVYPFWLGGVAATMAACFTHPLDLTKVRMQTLSSSTEHRKPSMVTLLRSSITQSGFRSLYTGLSASLMRQMSYSLVRIGVYEKLKTKVTHDSRSHVMQLLLAAGVAGGLGGIAGNPADIILVRMTSDSVRPPESRYNYRNAAVGFVRLVKDEGLKGMWRGLGTNTSRAVLMNVSQVGSYDFFKARILQQRVPIFDYKFRDNLLVHVLASLLSGTVATTICSPADVIRSRLMASSSGARFAHVVVKSFREEGLGFLFKGWTPAFARLGPNTVLLFVFFEQLKAACKKYTT